MKTYLVKEAFLSLQGEGANVGRRAVFVRFAGCNLWSGREEDRASAICRFCDTQFVGGTRYDAVGIARLVGELWNSKARPRFVVLTGGEPMLQVDEHLIDVLHRWECEAAIETNGTKPVPWSLDWITVSPKAGAAIAQGIGQELKVVFPQAGLDLDVLAVLPFRYRYLQPMDGPDRESNKAAALAYCLAHPEWRLSLQVHKILGIR